MSRTPGPLVLGPVETATLRREMLEWALRTAAPGEHQVEILGRAAAYYLWVSDPLRRDVAEAMTERAGAPLN